MRPSIVAMVLALLASVPASAQSGVSERGALVGYQRDRLAIRSADTGWYVVVDGYGRMLSAEQFARALGDQRTYRLTVSTSRRQTVVGGVFSGVGPVLMLAGLTQVGIGEWSGSTYITGTGYGALLVGTAATAGGIAMLADRRVKRPPTFYDEEQARRLVSAYNRRLLEAYGLSPEQTLWTPPRRTFTVDLVVAPTAVGVVGTF